MASVLASRLALRCRQARRADYKPRYLHFLGTDADKTDLNRLNNDLRSTGVREMAATTPETTMTRDVYQRCPASSHCAPEGLNPTFSKGFVPLHQAEKLWLQSFARLHRRVRIGGTSTIPAGRV